MSNCPSYPVSAFCRLLTSRSTELIRVCNVSTISVTITQNDVSLPRLPSNYSELLLMGGLVVVNGD